MRKFFVTTASAAILTMASAYATTTASTHSATANQGPPSSTHKTQNKPVQNDQIQTKK